MERLAPEPMDQLVVMPALSAVVVRDDAERARGGEESASRRVADSPAVGVDHSSPVGAEPPADAILSEVLGQVTGVLDLQGFLAGVLGRLLRRLGADRVELTLWPAGAPPLVVRAGGPWGNRGTRQLVGGKAGQGIGRSVAVELAPRGGSPGRLVAAWDGGSGASPGDADAAFLRGLAVRLDPYLLVALEHDRIRRAATRDGLTGLANHRAFYDGLEAALVRADGGRPVGVVLFDIEGLKPVNDTHGHPAGDALLRQFARLLEAHARPGDLVARYGGDEFAVVMPGAGRPQAEALGARVRRALGKRSLTSPLLRPVAVTYGAAASPGDGESAARLVALADHRLYDARGRRTGHIGVSGPGAASS